MAKAKAAAKKKAAPKKAAKKAAPKTAVKVKAMKKPKQAAAPKHENFMMRLLKDKEAHLKQAEADGTHNHDHVKEGFHSHARGNSFQKFAGHRRRNAS